MALNTRSLKASLSKWRSLKHKIYESKSECKWMSWMQAKMEWIQCWKQSKMALIRISNTPQLVLTGSTADNHSNCLKCGYSKSCCCVHKWSSNKGLLLFLVNKWYEQCDICFVVLPSQGMQAIQCRHGFSLIRPVKVHSCTLSQNTTNTRKLQLIC